MSRFSKARMAALAVGGALVLAACSSGPAAPGLAEPGLLDLTSRGYESVPCSDEAVLGDSFVPNEDTDYRAECWLGSPELPFTEEANELLDAIVIAVAGEDFTPSVCLVPERLSPQSGDACRAVIVGEVGDEAVVLMFISLTDVESVLASLGDEPTQEEIRSALVGQNVLVYMATQPYTRS